MNSRHSTPSANDRLKINSRDFAPHRTRRFSAVLALCLSVGLLAAVPRAHAQTESVIYNFTFGDGAMPNSTILMFGDNDIYGTSSYGGRYEGGLIFHVSASTGSESIVHSFRPPTYAFPAGIISGNGKYLFVGTTSGIGRHPNGTVYAIGFGARNGKPFSRLYSFNKGGNGSSPVSPLAVDLQGNFVGVTTDGGNYGAGEIYRLTGRQQLDVLHNFAGGSGDGATPLAGLIGDPQGNFYGTTSRGGSGSACSGGCGVVYKLAPDGTESVLYNFTGGGDGANPMSALALDQAGNLYGTTYEGGGAGCNGTGCGTVFKITPGGTETVLYSFEGGMDGAQPIAGLLRDGQDNLYGTTYQGGGTGCNGSGCGTVFKIAAAGGQTTLYRFTGGDDGGMPIGGLAMDSQGNLFGTASSGGQGGGGVVFKITQ